MSELKVSWKWDTQEAIELCRKLEPICATFNCHVALTGGLLYKDGPRKDCDIIVYRAGDSELKERGSFMDDIDRTALLLALAPALIVTNEYRRVVKCMHGGKVVDLIFPECDGEYHPTETSATEDFA